MELFWKEHDLTVTDVEDKLRASRQIAHTTVLTTRSMAKAIHDALALTKTPSPHLPQPQLPILESTPSKSIKSWDKAER
jgi:hypothetical protein